MDLETFRKLATPPARHPGHAQAPRRRRHPRRAIRKLAAERPGTFLLESAENGRSWSRYSFVGVRSAATLTARDGQAHWLGTPPVGVPVEGDPLAALRATIETLHTPHQEGLPPFTGGMVGYLGYDIVRRLEKIGPGERDDLKLPELTMLLTSDLAVMDHWEGAWLADRQRDQPQRPRHRRRRGPRGRGGPSGRHGGGPVPPGGPAPGCPAALRAARVHRPWGGPDFQAAVEDIKERIRAGEAFQVVPSQRFETPCTASALDVYRVLRATNPSPYMYLFRFDGFDVVGSSPEALVKVEDGHALVHPIAGTLLARGDPAGGPGPRRRLLADPKERAEHLMLVHLGRNDLGRVCEPGSVEVVDFMSVERYSHVMHIVSTVTGKVAEGRTVFPRRPHGLLPGTGSLSPARRSPARCRSSTNSSRPWRGFRYGGCVGELHFAGDSSTAIAIHTASPRNGTAYVQAGAGIVADSDPVAEDTECRNKAAAVLRAVHTANRLGK
ncbi:Anthranilate synthase component 1 OS=Streptomyces griseorubiginosus OX=67304 GN=trpE PE=3 SV=1 [Streptomyces griseorubiginosus]